MKPSTVVPSITAATGTSRQDFPAAAVRIVGAVSTLRASAAMVASRSGMPSARAWARAAPSMPAPVREVRGLQHRVDGATERRGPATSSPRRALVLGFGLGVVRARFLRTVRLRAQRLRDAGRGDDGLGVGARDRSPPVAPPCVALQCAHRCGRGLRVPAQLACGRCGRRRSCVGDLDPPGQRSLQVDPLDLRRVASRALDVMQAHHEVVAGPGRRHVQQAHALGPVGHVFAFAAGAVAGRGPAARGRRGQAQLGDRVAVVQRGRVRRAGRRRGRRAARPGIRVPCCRARSAPARRRHRARVRPTR